ncbi:methyl-accepting chemotaxis protein [Carboxydothermus hydrogenoformans]|uniref:Methyl-accepting chemotaxis protein n=1 Tax=Carboxydothermus hydrogenoformans (strain ATCC BAA-161 / DSM 6008 / Z-2901) TaxID=246194 RepID=Q3ACK4_CARHZ|nr:methyl-accepting chemotaxis protein [Carboxydothermus hydrogenoformans]ABB14554.1 methyl-accepting chemotaxis protein [Carboxydothermus hydrogenoformans Z-2901]
MKMPIGIKIGGGVILILLLFVAVAVWSLQIFDSIVTEVGDISTRIQMVDLDHKLINAFKEANRDAEAYLLYGNEKYKNDYLQDVENFISLINKRINNCLAEDRPKFDEVIANFNQYYDVLINQAFPLAAKGKLQDAISKAQSVSSYADAAEKILEELILSNKENTTTSLSLIQSESQEGRWLIIILNIVSLILGIIIAFWLTRMITKPLLLTVKEAQRIAEGDLTGGELLVKTKDELSLLVEAFNTMRANLRNIISTLIQTAKQVSDNSQQFANQAQQTAAGISETTAAMSEMATTVEQITQNTQAVSIRAEQVTAQATEGAKDVEHVMEQMKMIEESSNNASKVIEELYKTTGEITRIVDLITQIADQTNLLALNAAIEAARAGEHGRGFAVVAEEVRKLAEQSANAAKDIYELITNIQKETKRAVEAMATGVTEVKKGSVTVFEVGKKFKEIVSSIEEVTRQIQDVASAAEEISAGVQNVVASTEEQTAAIEEISASSEELASLAAELEKIAARFRV